MKRRSNIKNLAAALLVVAKEIDAVDEVQRSIKLVIELLNKDAQTIQEWAKEPRLDYGYSELVGNGELEDRVVTEVPDIKVFNKVSEPTTLIPCVQSMLNKGPQQGNRHVTAMRIVSHFKRHGIPSHYAKVSMLHWNNKSMNENKIIIL